MATDTKVKLTWQQKLEKGLPLDPMDETKADADFNYKRRLREAEEKKEFEALKARGHATAGSEEESDSSDDSGDNGGQKGKK